MKLCMMCDLHLPYARKAIQYDVLEWALEDMKKKAADAFLFAGDFTADGDRKSADRFMEKLRTLEIPVVVIPGNSDLRTEETRQYMAGLASPAVTVLRDVRVIAVNDSDRTVSGEAFAALARADENTVVMMHHPAGELKEPFRGKFCRWRTEHPETPVFYGHLHSSRDCGNDHCLQAADPDKAIGESPCITYYDTQARTLEKSFYFCPVPADIFDYIGVSCFHPQEDLPYATEHGLKTLELRPNAVRCDWEILEKETEKWRASGGRNFSMHAPEVTYTDSEAGSDEEWDRFLSLARRLRPDRLTVHVPKTSVRSIREDPRAMQRISGFLAEKLSHLDPGCVIGVENMHMTAADLPDDTRRFGYIPSEVLEYADVLQKILPNPVGVNFDTGHARNNPPFNQKYTLGAWYSEIGSRTVGYHIHQVIQKDGKLENHMPITDVYGKLISYASFFKLWQTGRIRRVPIICEIRGHGEVGAYRPTVELFEKLKKEAF